MLMNCHGFWVNTEKPGGRVFFVAQPTVTSTQGYTAAQGRAGSGKGPSDGNHGLDPTQPLATIAQAHTLATSGRGDTIVLLPGTVIITAAIAITKADITLMGYQPVPRGAKPGAVIQCATASVEMINVDADNVEIKDLTLDYNNTTNNGPIVDVSDTTACTGFIMERVFFDLEGSATDTDGIRLGDGTNGASDAVVKDCVFHGIDNEAIIVSDASVDCKIIGNIIYDGVQFATALAAYGINCGADRTTISGNEIKTAGTACINLGATAQLCQLNDNRLSAGGANTIGILLADAATGFGNGNVITAIAAGNLIDATTDADSPTVFADQGNVHAADPATAAFITPTIGGS